MGVNLDMMVNVLHWPPDSHSFPRLYKLAFLITYNNCFLILESCYQHERLITSVPSISIHTPLRLGLTVWGARMDLRIRVMMPWLLKS